MLYYAIILAACFLTLFLLRHFVGFKPKLTSESSVDRRTGWLSAIFWGLFFTFIFGDSIVVHNMNLAVWGEVSIFFAVFFLQIYLDRRTKLRGILLLTSLLALGVFYYVYSVTPDPS